MATITLTYDARNKNLHNLIYGLKTFGVRIEEKNTKTKEYYNEEFCKKMERGKLQRGKVIKTSDLWK